MSIALAAPDAASSPAKRTAFPQKLWDINPPDKTPTQTLTKSREPAVSTGLRLFKQGNRGPTQIHPKA